MDNTVRDKRGMSMDEACAYIGGVSRPTMYRLMGQGALSSYMIGNRRYFLRDELDEFLLRMMERDRGPQ